MFSSFYRILCQTGDKVLYPWLPSFAKVFWNHEAGPKTIFFWAPTFKWCLVMAGIADLKRPAEKLSIYQNAALFITGLIWTRYSFVIRPVNYNLASVNFFVSSIGLYQISRKIKHEVCF
ncbi:Mitochondrial pyruvate carrier 4 [Acanthocheilonema viteae]